MSEAAVSPRRGTRFPVHTMTADSSPAGLSSPTRRSDRVREGWANGGASETPLDPTVVAELREQIALSMRTQLLGKFEADTHALIAELRDAAARADAGGLLRIAHRLRGSAAMMGARALSDAVAAIEGRWREHGGADPDAQHFQRLQAAAEESFDALRRSFR